MLLLRLWLRPCNSKPGWRFVASAAAYCLYLNPGIWSTWSLIIAPTLQLFRPISGRALPACGSKCVHLLLSLTLKRRLRATRGQKGRARWRCHEITSSFAAWQLQQSKRMELHGRSLEGLEARVGFLVRLFEFVRFPVGQGAEADIAKISV
jgi:hypothetical protein